MHSPQAIVFLKKLLDKLPPVVQYAPVLMHSASLMQDATERTGLCPGDKFCSPSW